MQKEIITLNIDIQTVQHCKKYATIRQKSIDEIVEEHLASLDINTSVNEDLTIYDGRIASVEDVIKIIDRDILKDIWSEQIDGKYIDEFPFGIWFRGQNQKYLTDLEPTVFRVKKDSKNPENFMSWLSERSMFIHFQLRHPEHHSAHRNYFNWLCLMQHYGLPTRLLDWTESILIALFFAVTSLNTSKYHDDKNGVLYILNGGRLNNLSKLDRDRSEIYGDENIIYSPESLAVRLRCKMVTEGTINDIIECLKISKLRESQRQFLDKINDTSNHFNMNYPIAVFPNRVNDRTRAQSGVFTLHGGKICFTKCFKTGKEKINENCISECIANPFNMLDINEREEYKFLLKYFILAEDKKKIREQLRNLGIHKATLFPELDRQAQYVKEEWEYICNEKNKFIKKHS